MISSLPLRTALVATLIAAPASAQPVSLSGLFNLDRLATFGAQWAITALRGVARVTYADMDLRPLQGRMTVTGLDIAPYAEELAGCTIHLDRAVVSAAPLDQTASTSIDIDLLGATVSQACLDATGDNPLAAFGIGDVVLDRGKLALDYVFATGALNADLQALSPDLAEIRAQVAFDYFAVDVDREEPVAELASAQIELRDRGFMASLAPMIPPEFGDGEALAAALRQMLLSNMAPEEEARPDIMPVEPQSVPGNKAGGPKPPPMAPTEPATPMAGPEIETDLADVDAMIGQMATELAAFVNAPGRLVLTLAPPAPVRLSEQNVGDFMTFARLMQPRLSAGTLPETEPVTAHDRDAILGWLAKDGTAVADEDALRMARALLSGIGAPRDPVAAMRVLSPLLAANNPEAVALALDQLDTLEPSQAYRVARRAAGAGDRSAFAHLDRLERELGLMRLIELQSEGAIAATVTGTETALDLRERAYAALTGLGTPRSYADAYYYALLALAGGDRAAASIVDEIEAMGRRLGDDEASQWAQMLTAVRARATDTWFAAH